MGVNLGCLRPRKQVGTSRNRRTDNYAVIFVGVDECCRPRHHPELGRTKKTPSVLPSRLDRETFVIGGDVSLVACVGGRCCRLGSPHIQGVVDQGGRNIGPEVTRH